MNRYIQVIEADKAVLENVMNIDTIRRILIAIDKQATTNVVEVIRCKDCKFFVPFVHDANYQNQGICNCLERDTLHGSEFYPYINDFCNYGKRKE